MAGVIKNYLNHKKDMELIRLDHIDKEIELELMKQSKYVLENEERRPVLDRFNAYNKRLEVEKDNKWLIQETRERQLEKHDE